MKTGNFKNSWKKAVSAIFTYLAFGKILPHYMADLYLKNKIQNPTGINSFISKQDRFNNV